MAEQLKVIIDADVTKAVAGIQTLSKVITSDFSKAAQTASSTAQSLTKSIDLLKDQFQSIGKIKIDSTDLNTIQAKLDSIKIKPLHLDFDLTGETEVNKAIASIRAKFESLKFNPDLSVFNEIVAEINKLKSNDVILHVDNSEALGAINKIQSSLNSIKGEILISGNVDAAIAGIKEKIAALRTIDLKADPSQAILAIDKIISEITKIKDTDVLLKADNTQALKSVNQLESQLKDIRANVVINTSGFEAAKKNVLDIDKAFAQATTNVESLIDKMVADAVGGFSKIKSSFGDLGKVSLDSSQVTNAIEQLRTRLQTLQGQVAITVTATGLEKLNADIEQTKEDLKSLVSRNIKIDVDETAALQKVGLLKSQLASISNVPFKFDASNAIKGISNLQDQVHNLQNSLKTTSGLNAFQAALGKSSAAASQLQTKGAGLVNFYNRVGEASNKAALSIGGKFPKATNEASFAMLNFGRVIQDAPFGILGIANNLNPLIESMGRASAAAKATGTSLTKNLLGALKGAGGIGIAVSVVSSLLIVFGDRLFGAGKKAEEAAREIKSAFKVIEDSTDSVQGDIANVNALVKAATNTSNSLKIQAAAIDELQKINKEYFGGLEAGKTSFEQITIAANNYTQSLITQAIVEGLKEEISELSKQIRAATKEYNDLTAKTTAAGKAVNNFTVKTGGGERALDQQASSINDLNSSYEALDKRLKKSASTLGGLKTQFNSLSDEINKQILLSLKIKPPPIDDKDFDDETDKILAKARRFVKEFGDTFVLPDLDETFFRGVKEILPDAKKLLEDVKIGNLKIKIPKVEFEFLSDGITPLTKEQLDDLTRRFFSDLKPIEAPLIIDPTIQFAVDQGKLKDALKEAVSKGDFSTSLDLLQKIDLNPAIKGVQGLSDSLKQSALLINDTLTPAFQSLFDAIIAGKNPLTAFFDSLKDSITQVIKKLIAAAIQAAILSAITGGASGTLGGFGKIFKGLLGLGGVSNPGGGFGLGGAISGRSFQNTLNVVVQGQISGQTILLAGQRAAGSNNR